MDDVITTVNHHDSIDLEEVDDGESRYLYACTDGDYEVIFNDPAQGEPEGSTANLCFIRES